MHENIVLDTDIVIHLLRQTTAIVDKFNQLYEEDTIFLLSPIVITEIYVGAFSSEYETIENFFSLCQFSPISVDIAKQAGICAKQYRKAYNIGRLFVGSNRKNASLSIVDT